MEGIMVQRWGESAATAENALHWLIDNGRGALVDYRLVRPRAAPAARGWTEQSEMAEATGDGSPFRTTAVEACWERCQQLQHTATASDSPNVRSAARIRAESGVSVDANPYFGLTREKLEAVIRAAYTSRQMPETLLALWAKEGSHRMVTTAHPIPQATTPANAKTIFRCKVYYEDLGADHFILTTRPPGGDNVWDSRDSAASRHEAHFIARVRDLVSSGDLSEDISAAINAELSVNAAPSFAVTPSVKFYALSLLLVDALFSRMQRNSFTQLTSLTSALNYMQWNMGTDRFRDFLASADQHRREPAFVTSGAPISLERWALHTIPKQSEWRQPRLNAIRFLYYLESYRPIFELSLNLIKPGIEDLRPPGNVG
jgi:hypothetical protein